MNDRKGHSAVVVVGAGVAAALHVGKLPTALPVLRDALGITLVQSGFLLSLVQLAGMLLGIFVGLAADSLGLKRTMTLGLVLLAGASGAGALADSARTMLALRAVEGFGFLLASMPAPSLIRRIVPAARVNAALGMWGAYMPLGTALALVAGAPMLEVLGWRGWWAVLAALALGAAAVLWVRLPADAVAARESGRSRAWLARLRRTLATAGPWLIAMCFGVYSAQWLSVIGFLPTVYAQAGVGAAWAGTATAFAALVNMAGNIAAGRLLQRGARAHHLLAVGFVAMGVGAIAAFADELPAGARYAGVLMFSMVGGLIPGTLFSLAVRLAPGDDAVSTTVGWMQQWSSFGQFAGPPVVALVAARVGGWQWSGGVTDLCALTGLMLAGAIARELHGRRH